MKLADDDKVVSVFPGWDDYELLLVTAGGQGIRFAEDEVRPVGRSAGSMRGIKLKGDDRVVGGCAVAHEEIVVIATEAGLREAHRGRRVPGAGAGRLGTEGGEDRQGARGSGRGRARRPTRSRSSRRTARWSCRPARCAAARATAAARRCAASRASCCASCRCRIHRELELTSSYGAGFSTVFQSRVVR